MAAEWFYADQGQQCGPVTFEELQRRATAGQLRPSDLVWRPGLDEWLPASSQPGLFGGPGPAPRAADPSLPSPFDKPSYEPSAFDRPAFDRPRPINTGMGAGLKILLFGGGAFLLLGVLCCGVLIVIGVAMGSKTNEYKWNLNSNEHRVWNLRFNKGDKVQIIVTSDGQSDMDLFVFTEKGKMDAFLNSPNLEKAVGLCYIYDNHPSKDCRLDFVAPSTQEYYVVLVNRMSADEPHRNGRNSGKLVYYPAPK
jgi:hypothetical protein